MITDGIQEESDEEPIDLEELDGERGEDLGEDLEDLEKELKLELELSLDQETDWRHQNVCENIISMNSEQLLLN